MTVLYHTSASAIGGRSGSATVDDGTLTLLLAAPRELGGAGGEGVNPEQLFACGYAACFLSSLRFVAARCKVALSDDSKVAVKVGIGTRADSAGFSLDVALTIFIPDLAPTLVAQIVEDAHATCPYSHLTREGVDVRLTIA